MILGNKNKMKGFTLVELLAVIVILAIILVIAVPKVMTVIEDSKKATLESTAKMIASAAEKAKVQNTVLGKDTKITCKSVAKINDIDYEDCSIDFDDNTAKVTITGSGKFDGLYVCNGTKTETTATSESCTPVVNLKKLGDDDWATIVETVKQAEENGTEYPYEVGSEKTVDMGSLGTHTIRVANTTKCSDEWKANTQKSQTACGFVLEFSDIITTHEMKGDSVNSSGATNQGGWPASTMRKYLNDIDATTDEDGVIYNALPKEIRDGIINTYVISGRGPNTTVGILENENAGVLEDRNYWSNDKLYLLSTEEVWAQESSDTPYKDASIGTSRQLDYYEENGVNASNYSGAIKKYNGSPEYWWLRSATSTGDITYFFLVFKLGMRTQYTSFAVRGVSLAFRLAN